jgi:hypothetical protein
MGAAPGRFACGARGRISAVIRVRTNVTGGPTLEHFNQFDKVTEVQGAPRALQHAWRMDSPGDSRSSARRVAEGFAIRGTASPESSGRRHERGDAGGSRRDLSPRVTGTVERINAMSRQCADER